MRVALLISGYLRTLKYNIPNIQEKILSKFENVDIYIHITSNENITDKYYNRDNNSYREFIEEKLKPLVLIKESNYKFMADSLENDVYNSWIKYYKLNILKKENEKIFGDYDLVIKYRPDLNLISEDIFEPFLENKIYLPFESLIDKNKLIQESDPSICDIFAYGKSKEMDRYFDIFLHLKDLITNHGHVSETLLYFYLNKNNIPYIEKDIEYRVLLSQCNTFAICGDSGSGKTTLSNILKNYFANPFTLECDRYHKWERDSDKWKTLTHLNPEANFITKMSKDIFNLKLGKTVYCVDYDHSTGKFTDKKQIESVDNIIVCGLHSLYSDDYLYNLKIYMDTDRDLRYLWKVRRDIKCRGHSKEKVIEQIKSREIDYKRYIYPQREAADIIINFYPKEQINFNDINLDLDVGLRIIIKKNFRYGEVLSILDKNNIQYTRQSSIEHYTFDFPSFTPLKNNKNMPFKRNDYYDYVMVFILNLYK